MNYQSDVIWINQSLYSYADKSYNSDGYLELTSTVTTQDNSSFSQPKITVSIANSNKRRVCNLTQSNCIDLLQSIKEATSDAELSFTNRFQIVKNYNRNRNLIVAFLKSKSTGENLIAMRILFNDSDFGTVILPYFPEFTTVVNNFQSFVNDYHSWCRDLKTSYLLQEILKTNVQVSNGIKVLPSMISTGSITQTSEPVIENPKEEPVEFDTTNMDEFSKFVNENEDKVKIPELESTSMEEKPPITQTFNSRFIDEVLKKKLEKLEQIFNASLTSSDIFNKICTTVSGLEMPIDLLPNIKDNEYKSFTYLSNYFFKLNFMNFQINGATIPVEAPLTFYVPTGVEDSNMELAYDLFTVAAYIKVYRNKREFKSNDPNVNGAILHFATRCFLDPLIFSFTRTKVIEVVKNCVVTRYKYFKEIGLFESYDKQLSDNLCQEITIQEIQEYVDKACRASGHGSIIEMHQTLYEKGSVKVPPNSNYTIEQITNEIIPIEVQVRLGKDINELTQNQEVINLISSKNKPSAKKEKKKVNKETNILRWVKLKALEVPESYREKFVNFISELEENDYNFENDEFRMEELGDSIIKGLYIWNQSEKKEGYTSFAAEVESSIPKDLIIANIKESSNLKDTTGSSGGEWISFSLNI